MAGYLPIVLNVESRRCLIVGGGAVAHRRALTLSSAGTSITVVAPEVCEEMNRLAVEAVVTIVREPYSAKHLNDCGLVFACTNSTAVNDRVVHDCNERGILVNNAESAEVGDFLIPSIVRWNELIISVTTCGASPSLAARIAGELEARYGPEYGAYTYILAEARGMAKQIASPSERRAALQKLANDESILELIRAGDLPAARERALKCISSSPD